MLIGIKRSHTFSRITIPQQGILESVAIKAKIGGLQAVKAVPLEETPLEIYFDISRQYGLAVKIKQINK